MPYLHIYCVINLIIFVLYYLSWLVCLCVCVCVCVCVLTTEVQIVIAARRYFYSGEGIRKFSPGFPLDIFFLPVCVPAS